MQNLKIDALTFASAKILTETKMPRMEAMPVIQPMIRVPVFKEQQPQQLDSKGMIGQSENQREMVSEGESVPGLLSRQWKWAPTVSVLCSSFSPQPLSTDVLGLSTHLTTCGGQVYVVQKE